MEHRTYKRTHYFVYKKFQLRYIGLIISIIIASALMTGYTIYYNSWTLLGEKLANVYPQGRLISIFKSVNIRLALNLALIAAFCVLIGLLASHRIAGPVYRMIKFLDGVAGGDYSQRLRLRKNDELKDLADAINRVVDSLTTHKEKS